MARPSKFTEATVDKLVQAIRLGATYDLAAKSAGISPDTLTSWKAGNFPRGADRDLKDRFLGLLEKAEGDAAVQWLAKIEKAASDGHWQAAAWKLERRYPREYGRQVHEVTGTDGGPLVIQFAQRTDGPQ